MAMQDRKTQYSWKSTSLSLLLSKLLISFWNAASSVLFWREKRLQLENRSPRTQQRLGQVCASRLELKEAQSLIGRPGRRRMVLG
jgi:uncharacterized protein YpmS